MRDVLEPLEQLKIAAALVVRTRVFFDAWWLSAGEPGRSDNLSFWEDNWNHWRFNEHALLFSFIVHIAGLFERRNDTICFHSPLKNITGRRMEIKVSRINDLLNEASPIIKSVTILRSSSMAHRSAKLAYNGAFLEAHTTPNDLKGLSDISLLIVNELLEECDLPPTEFCESAIDDLKSLVSQR
jgi:hypothetical protein